ncbi:MULTISPECIES: MarR family winged helix-turn-helix transcriptional regulator [unclassified Streptomyces]|uniref:MarR family winged helix-turn-helix transcriptional regulator n=1 Tax=unclassified Streptomyces TaxID=2593676 RepID=UPI001B37EFAB|nr:MULTISPECIES: helix-turn-helix domain-containing protein [unclassified Streptomyces]MBQ0865480.1 MarR family transcriptional regulator [Streptomyces sp. RK75]MBQ1123239.1 MarR family transcriptional regulator [Streptomyces sp. B15]
MEEHTVARADTSPERLMEDLRTFGANYAEFTRRFAAWLGLHSTDAAALAEILYAEDKGAPLSPARLSERIGLSSGATTALLNRLEKAGHVVRRREHTDRRIVTLRSSPEVRPQAIKFFGSYSERLAAEISRYPPEQLRQFQEFVTHLSGTMNSLLAHEYHALEPGDRPGTQQDAEKAAPSRRGRS